MTQYKHISDIEHALQCPDVYVGTIENKTQTNYVYDLTRVYKSNITYNTGLLKVFDEIITNAIDNIHRNTGMKNIVVDIFDGYISIYNDGTSIPIELYKGTSIKEKIYIPELIFTRTKTSSNYDSANRVTGGKNGLGAKLACIYSKEFIIEIANKGQLYTQYVYDNCSKIDPPEIIPTKDNDFVRITFKPDYEYLKCTMTQDNMHMLFKRVHDLTHLPIQITLNDTKLKHLSWNEFVDSYNMSNIMLYYTTSDNRWKIGFGMNNDKKCNVVSFVNNINTLSGGQHVNYIIKQITEHVRKALDANEPKSKSKSTEQESKKSVSIKPKIALVLYSIIEDPSFQGQTKDELCTTPTKFGSTCIIPSILLDSFISRSGILSTFTTKKISTALPAPRRKGKLTHIQDLSDAEKAGTAQGYKCTLFLCEGKSAKAMCDVGMGVVGHEYYGCFPMRGKTLNTTNASDKKYDANRELSYIKEVLGLTDGIEYTSTESLRYGKVVCMKDADEDGASIMALVINFFNEKFPSLLKIPGFFCEFISPMIKVIWKKGGKETIVPFYNEIEYKQYMAEHQDDVKRFKPTVKFIKGLAGNNPKEQVEYFKKYKENCINIEFTGNYEHVLTLAFNKKYANARKTWLTNLTEDTFLPRHEGTPINIIDFLNTDFLTFSYKDCVRSIPSIVDGLKPSQRKILYTLFCKGESAYKFEKVFQLGGKVAEKAHYHHGNQSMDQTIINMTQDYNTSGNNIPLLSPDGSFGSRFENGADAGAPRYISCCLSKVARLIFPKDDDELLEYTHEDDVEVEPKYYIPIVPFILFNGTLGIGTGWSTFIPSFNPLQIIEYVKNTIQHKSTNKIEPFYRGFKGEYIPISTGYTTVGIINEIPNSSRNEWVVTELPIGYSLSQFEARLKFLIDVNEKNITQAMLTNYESEPKSVKDSIQRAKKEKYAWTPLLPIVNYRNECTLNDVKYIIEFKNKETRQNIMTALKMQMNISTNNMVLFNSYNEICKFDSIASIIEHWGYVRQQLYNRRKEYQLKKLREKALDLHNRTRFIQENIDNIIHIKNVPKQTILDMLTTRGYDRINESYDYLLSMKIYTLTKEKYDKLLNKYKDILSQIQILTDTSIYTIWMEELNTLEQYILLNY